MGKSLTGHACHIYLGFHINGSSFTVNRIACLKEMSPLDFTDNLKTLSKSFTNCSMKIIITEFHIFYFRIGCSGASTTDKSIRTISHNTSNNLLVIQNRYEQRFFAVS